MLMCLLPQSRLSIICRVLPVFSDNIRSFNYCEYEHNESALSRNPEFVPENPTFFVKVMAVLIAHLVFIGVLLIQGCAETQAPPSANTTAVSPKGRPQFYCGNTQKNCSPPCWMGLNVVCVPVAVNKGVSHPIAIREICSAEHVVIEAVLGKEVKLKIPAGDLPISDNAGVKVT